MRDSGSIVVGWLTKLALLFAVLGVLAFDGVSVIVANVGAADDATTAASAAADVYKVSKNVQQAYNAAAAAVTAKGDTVETKNFKVYPDGSIRLTVERHAPSLWMQHIGPLKKVLLVKQDGTGSPPA